MFILFGVGEGIGNALGATIGEIVAVAVGVEITAFAAGLFESVEFELFHQTIPPMPPAAKMQTTAIGNIQNNFAMDFDSDFFSKIGEGLEAAFLLSISRWRLVFHA